MDAAKALRPLPPGQFCAKENRAMFRAVLIVDKPLVCQRICPTACLRTVSPTAAQCSGAAHCVCSRLQPLRGLQRPAVGAGMHFYVSHRPTLRLRGVPCLRTSCARHFSPSGLHLFASVCSAKNARNDVHAVISDLSLVLPRLCQCSELPLESRGAFWLVAQP